MGSRPSQDEYGKVFPDASKELALPVEVNKWVIFVK
tara:strand:+ start:731 stop:838 length:108 start_codon:yes stop_codon:yes gene_type:complete